MINLKKIDPSLLLKVKNLNCCDENLNCIVYTNSILETKKYLLKVGCDVVNEYPFIKALGVNLKSRHLSVLSGCKYLQYVTSSAQVFTQVNTSKKVCNLYNLTKGELKGENIAVAVIDTGIRSHLDFVCPTNRIICFKDFVNNKSFPYDDNGHGTFISSVLGGNGLISGRKYEGIAPKVNLVVLKALDERGETGAFTILEAMQWVFDNKEKYNIKVICMSFGSNPLGNSDPLKLGAETLWDNGIIVVAAAGNSGPEKSSIKSPGISSKIVTVGALDDGRTPNGKFDKKLFKVADFSSRGPAFRFYKPDLITSGVNLIGASNNINENYTIMSGTSVATPIVAGVCALLCQKYSNITPSQIKSILLNNTIPITRDRNKEGYGYLYFK